MWRCAKSRALLIGRFGFRSAGVESLTALLFGSELAKRGARKVLLDID